LKENPVNMKKECIKFKGRTFYWKCFFAGGSYYESDSHFAFTDENGKVQFSDSKPEYQMRENR